MGGGIVQYLAYTSEGIAYRGRAQSQLTAILKFTMNTSTFDGLTDVKAPVLVTNGHTDIMSPTSNSFVLQQEIPDAQLHLYPYAGHGNLFQVPELYAMYLELFLNN
ncbi:alpha/beta fold hydrolase [Aspergillus stella-maris]|uniref:alpha/beta fold hydrolase n=1 Tax=Aspergillus stella-maris TaxID=1810926 RepID=UPI003CCE39FF